MSDTDTLDLILLHRVSDGDFVFTRVPAAGGALVLLYRGKPVGGVAAERLKDLADDGLITDAPQGDNQVRLTNVGNLAALRAMLQ